MRALLEMWVLFEGGPYMRKYGNEKLMHMWLHTQLAQKVFNGLYLSNMDHTTQFLPRPARKESNVPNLRSHCPNLYTVFVGRKPENNSAKFLPI